MLQLITRLLWLKCCVLWLHDIKKCQLLEDMCVYIAHLMENIPRVWRDPQVKQSQPFNNCIKQTLGHKKLFSLGLLDICLHLQSTINPSYNNGTSYYNCLISIHDKCFNVIQTFYNSTTCAVSVIYNYRKTDYGHTLFKVRQQTELTKRQKRAPYYKKDFLQMCIQSIIKYCNEHSTDASI